MSGTNPEFVKDGKECNRLTALFLTSGLFFDPDSKGVSEKFRFLSEHLDGFVIGAVYRREQKYRRLGTFHAHSIYLASIFRGYRAFSRLARLVAFSVYAVAKSLKIHYIDRQKLDVVIACDPFKTGSYGWIISRLTGASLIVELNGNYIAAFQLEGDDIQSSRLRRRMVLWLIGKVIPRANGLKLLYPTQLEGLLSPAYVEQIRFLKVDELSQTRKDLSISRPCALSMHNLVPLRVNASRCEPDVTERVPYILLVGHPWYLKGADLLINAFLSVCDEFPEVHLRIVGYCEDPRSFNDLARNHERIELCPSGVPHSEALEMIANCHVYVLASRTEAMGRVLLEAMAAERPIIAADVDGVPQIVRDNHNGLLFESGSATELAKTLKRLLSDAELRERLASNGLKDVNGKFSEAKYAEYYSAFMQLVSA